MAWGCVSLLPLLLLRSQRIRELLPEALHLVLQVAGSISCMHRQQVGLRPAIGAGSAVLPKALGCLPVGLKRLGADCLPVMVT